MKANEITRQDITEEYCQEAVEKILESANADGSEPMSRDELLESLDSADED